MKLPGATRPPTDWRQINLFLRGVIPAALVALLSAQCSAQPLRFAGPAASQADAVRSSGAEIVAEIPPGICVLRLAVLPLKGDPGFVWGGALTEALTRRGCTVLERESIEDVLKDPNIPRDRVDDAYAVRAGRLMQAEAVIIGSVYRQLDLPGIHYRNFTLRIVDTSTSKVLWVKNDAVAGEISKKIKLALCVAGLLLLLLGMLLLDRSLTVSSKKETFCRIEGLRGKIADSINYCDAKAAALIPLAQGASKKAIKDLRTQCGAMRATLAGIQHGTPAMLPLGRLREIEEVCLTLQASLDKQSSILLKLAQAEPFMLEDGLCQSIAFCAEIEQKLLYLRGRY